MLKNSKFNEFFQKPYLVILVKLTGGATSKEGTVYVWNQVNQRYEGVCDDAWDK